mmetsp:Transcript_22352/g.60410  ORF Transcript_22352/g.60410 Transcript_22352/m.60410 type:complete len:264 (-) Transcript_22352:1204-1995(-)
MAVLRLSQGFGVGLHTLNRAVAEDVLCERRGREWFSAPVAARGRTGGALWSRCCGLKGRRAGVDAQPLFQGRRARRCLAAASGLWIGKVLLLLAQLRQARLRIHDGHVQALRARDASGQDIRVILHACSTQVLGGLTRFRLQLGLGLLLLLLAPLLALALLGLGLLCLGRLELIREWRRDLGGFPVPRVRSMGHVSAERVAHLLLLREVVGDFHAEGGVAHRGVCALAQQRGHARGVAGLSRLMQLRRRLLRCRSLLCLWIRA